MRSAPLPAPLSVYRALRGAYGVLVNADIPALGEPAGVFAGIRFYELAKQIKTRYVRSELEDVSKYHAEQHAGKARVRDWMRAHEPVAGENSMSWTILARSTSQARRHTRRLREPDREGPRTTLTDLGFWARSTFDRREQTSGQDLELARQTGSGGDYLVEPFARVTGKKAEYAALSLEDWFLLLDQGDIARRDDVVEGELCAQTLEARDPGVGGARARLGTGC
ncbi:hypothetical protein BC628DRAFT_1423898 [Trametes gibbosa]|nr:hypothetical protein BC628DRAFT_1423898 [Trametes gibbosa]